MQNIQNGGQFMIQQTEKKKITLKPLANRVVAQRLEEETFKGGILIPDSAKKKQETAKVIAVGPGKKTDSGNLIPIPVKVGDTILVDKYAGQEITLDDEEFIIVKSDDIIAIIE
jgi:chaperonin GroES